MCRQLRCTRDNQHHFPAAVPHSTALFIGNFISVKAYTWCLRTPRIQSNFTIFRLMKSSQIIKIVLLALPILLLVYVMFIRDRLDAASGIGGGGYDLTKMYTLIGVGLYLLVLNLFFLIQTASGNRLLLMIGVITLICTIVMAIRNF